MFLNVLEAVKRFVLRDLIVPVCKSSHCFCPDAKRLIGRRFEDSVVQSDMKHWPFKVVSDGGKPKVEVEYKGEIKTFFPEEVSSMVLTKMKEISEAYLGKVRLISFKIKATYMINIKDCITITLHTTMIHQ